MPSAIRLATSDDAAHIHAIYTPIVVQTTISFELEPPSVDGMRERIDSTLQQYPWLVYCADDHVVGYAYASQHRSRWAYQWACDVSVYVHADWRGRAIGKRLYAALFALLRWQGYVAAFAGVALPNPASLALHRGVGFVDVGVYQQVGYKFGAWHDVLWLQCELQPRSANPTPPISMQNLSPEVLRTLVDHAAD